MKRLTSIFIAMICALTLLTPAVAYAAIDEELSNLTVVMNYGGEKLGGINVSICRVADAKEVSGGIVYDTTPAFSGAGADFTNLTETKNIAQAASLNTYKYAADGHEIVYTVDEVRIDGYRKWVITTDGYNIINEYSPGDNTEDIPDVPPPLGPPDEGPDVPYTRDFPEDGPKTNDDSNMQLWIMLIAAGSIGLLAVLIVMNSKRFTRILPRK